jgi:hypothetical protein
MPQATTGGGAPCSFPIVKPASPNESKSKRRIKIRKMSKSRSKSKIRSLLSRS